MRKMALIGLAFAAVFTGERLWADGTNLAAADEIVVTATRTEKAAKDVPASVEVISQEQIAVSGAKTVDELLGNLVGVDLQGSGLPGAFVRMNLRGLTPGYQSERVLVLVDGRRINDVYQGNVEFGQLPADGIASIEMLRGPASALYGSNAEGGVINIVTRRGTPDPVTELSAAAGNFNTRRYGISHGWQTGPVDYFISVGRATTDGYTHNSDGTERDWSAVDFSGNVGVQIDPQSEIRLFGGCYAGQGTDENSDRDVDRNYQQADYRLNWDEKRDAKLLARVWRTDSHQIYDWKYPGRGVYDQETLAGEVQQSLWIFDGHLLTAGLEERRESADVDEVAQSIDRTSGVHAGYVQDEILAGETLRFTVGVREDYDSDYGGALSPRLSVLWRAASWAETYASYGRANRAPSLSDRYVNVEYNGARFEGNPDLKPETLDAYEIGLRARPAEGTECSAAVFLNDLRDGFDFLLESDGVFRNRNATRIRSAGVETSLRYCLAGDWWTFANYSYTDGTYEEFDSNPAAEGTRLAYLAAHKAAAGLEYLRKDGLSGSLSARYASPRYGDAQNTAENKMSDYVVAACHARVPVCERTYVTLDVENLFDRTYQELPGINQAGRFVMAGMQVVF